MTKILRNYDKNFEHQHLAYDFSYENEIRVGKKLIEFKDEIQFEKDIIEYVKLANEYILRYREFQNVRYAKDYIINNLDDSNWNPYIKSMLCFLTDEINQGRKYYEMFLNNSFFKDVIEEYNYPTNFEVIDKEYVLGMIKNQRHFLHEKSAMKKMKNYTEWE